MNACIVEYILYKYSLSMKSMQVYIDLRDVFLVTVQSAKVNLPKYRTPRDGH